MVQGITTEKLGTESGGNSTRFKLKGEGQAIRMEKQNQIFYRTDMSEENITPQVRPDKW